MGMKYIASGLHAKVSCMVVVCLRIADPWTNHDQTGDATFSFWGTRLQRWCRAFLFILLMGLPAGLSQGPPCHQVHKLGTSVQSLTKRRHPQSSRRSLPCVLSSRDEDVRPWMVWMMKVLTIHDNSYTKKPYNSLDPLYQVLSLRHVESNFVSAKRWPDPLSVKYA